MKTDPKNVNFHDVITSRRSVRLFTDTQVPDEVIDKCLDMALLAPNSSNLQPWEFYVIENPEIHKKAIEYCMSQNAAKTANKLIVCVARSDTWRQNAQDNIKFYPVQPVPKAVKDYYGKLIPIAMGRGAMNVLSPAKWVAINALRQVKGAMVEPMYSETDIKTWALANLYLACQNFMLAVRAFGFDSCPMGGFDEPKMKQLLGLHAHQHIGMVIAVGERAEKGIYAEQYRFDKKRFVFKV